MIKKKKKRLRPSKKEKRIEGSEDQRKERKKKEKWRRKQRLSIKSNASVCCSDSGSFRVCLITKVLLETEF